MLIANIEIELDQQHDSIGDKVRTRKRRKAFLHSEQIQSSWDQPLIGNWSAGALLPVVFIVLIVALAVFFCVGVANHWFGLPNSPLTPEGAKYLIR